MFGNRKRKHQDDEESLVPHGLIWHATAEPAPEVVQNEESLSHTVQFAQGIEQARRPQSPPEIPPRPQALSQPPIPAPAPLPWWRVQPAEPEPVRPISKPILLPLSAYAPPPPVEPSVDLPRTPQIQPTGIQPSVVRAPQIQRAQIQPVQAQPVPIQPTQVPQGRVAQLLPVPQVPVTQLPAPVQGARVQTPQVPKPKGEVRKPSIQNTPTAGPKTKRNSEAVSRGVAWLRASSQHAWRTAILASGKVRGSWLRVSQSLELQQAILRARKRGQELLRRGVAGTRGYAQSAGITITNLSHASLEHLKRMSARSRSVSAAGRKQISAVVTQRFNSERIRTVVAGPVLRAKTQFAQPMSQWRMKRDRLAIDSRFWTSMTLAGISALIVLGIVSVVPNYAAKSLPSRILGANSAVNADVATPVVLAAPPQASSSQAGPPRPSKAAAKKTVDPKLAPEKPASPKAAATPKTRRAADDDYVAPDTYKYYGTGSKRSR
jgi:hypothetical protein